MTRNVCGPTDRVVIVGAGLGGLSAALRLAAAGREVTILEREPRPGGRAGLLEQSGYTFDTGPSVLTMPDLIAETFDCVGEVMADWLDLRAVDPAYRAYYRDGSTLDVHADPERMAGEIARVCGPSEAAGYCRFLDYLRRLYTYQIDDFIDRNIDSPLALLTPNLAKLAAIGAFRRLAPKVASYLHDQRTQQIFSFQAMYAGVSPYQALALYAVISYLDTVGGVYFPRGGMHAVPRALAGAAIRHGIDIRYGVEAVRVEMRGRRATAVLTAAGERIPADVVVLNPDLPVAYRELLRQEPRKVRNLRYSPSCFLMLAGSRAAYPGAAHHNIHFGTSWRVTFTELIDRGQLMSDPSFLITSPTRSDPQLAPPGRHSYYILFPTPNQLAGLDWDRLGPAYRDQVVRTVSERGYPGFGEAIEVERVTTPADWERQGMAAGTPFAAAHTLGQTGPFRPGNTYGENIVFAGSGTQPGVGVPMVLISGRLAAERITGPAARRRRR